VSKIQISLPGGGGGLRGGLTERGLEAYIARGDGHMAKICGWQSDHGGGGQRSHRSFFQSFSL
jgi:hypothetical protein